MQRIYSILWVYGGSSSRLGCADCFYVPNMAVHAFIGTWEVIGYRYVNGTCNDNHGLEGVRFRLDENGDVTWIVPEELKSVPLFSCETYELDTASFYVSLRFGEYAGHVLEFKSDQRKPKENVVLTCEGWCMLHCRRIHEDVKQDNCYVQFSLLTALEEGYFSDLTITSQNNKQFKTHTLVLNLLGSDIDWTADSHPLFNLPEDVLGTILHYFYAECLPENLNEFTTRQVISVIGQYPCLCKLSNMCQMYLKNMALKQQIIGLVNDMHACMNQIISHLTTKDSSSPSDSITSNPAKLCLVVKQCIRDAAIVVAKLILLCDLFTTRKSELSREERHEIIRYAKSRFPIFLTQLQQFLQVLKSTFSSMTAAQRNEVATFLVPEIEIILDMISTLIIQVESAMEQIIQVLAPHESGRSKSSVGDMLGRSLRNILHIKELKKLRNFNEYITCCLGLLIHKKQSFNEMTSAQKIRSITRNLEHLIEELPIFLVRLEEVTAVSDEKLEWRDFKFCFKVGTSKVSGVLKKLVAHRDTLQDVITQLCELVQREAFNQSLQSLGILDIHSSPSHDDVMPKLKRSSSNSTPTHNYNYKLNLVESLCVPPASNASLLSKSSLTLFKNGTNTDMEFEVISTAEGDNPEDFSPTEENCCTIKAHRVIVASRCDWFRRALQSGMKEDIDKKIVIHDANPDLFAIFLEYLYSGRLRQSVLSTEQLVDLLLLSDRYEVDTLKQACEFSLESAIDQDCAIYFLSLADHYNAKTLRNSCLNFISHHQELTESEVFYELPLSLQAEIFDFYWTQPFPQKTVLPKSTSRISPDSSMADLESDLPYLNLGSNYHHSTNDSLDEYPVTPDMMGRLDRCIGQIREIVGENATREQLVQVILAADFDLCRAINYFYARNSEPH